MKINTKILLAEAWRYCDIKDKSTEFMLQYMQDVAKVDLDCVLNFLGKYDGWVAVYSELKRQKDKI